MKSAFLNMLTVFAKLRRLSLIHISWLTEFLRAFSLSARLNLHVGTIRGSDPHHIMEAAFKATGLALRAALRPDGQRKMVPSTKGVIV